MLPAGPIAPSELDVGDARRWRRMLRDDDGRTFEERDAWLRQHETAVHPPLRIEVFFPADAMARPSLGWSAATVVGWSATLRRFRVVYDVDTARDGVDEDDLHVWEDLLLLARACCVKMEGDAAVRPRNLRAPRCRCAAAVAATPTGMRPLPQPRRTARSTRSTSRRMASATARSAPSTARAADGAWSLHPKDCFEEFKARGARRPRARRERAVVTLSGLRARLTPSAMEAADAGRRSSSTSSSGGGGGAAPICTPKEMIGELRRLHSMWHCYAEAGGEGGASMVGAAREVIDGVLREYQAGDAEHRADGAPTPPTPPRTRTSGADEVAPEASTPSCRMRPVAGRHRREPDVAAAAAAVGGVHDGGPGGAGGQHQSTAAACAAVRGKAPLNDVPAATGDDASDDRLQPAAELFRPGLQRHHARGRPDSVPAAAERAARRHRPSAVSWLAADAARATASAACAAACADDGGRGDRGGGGRGADAPARREHGGLQARERPEQQRHQAVPGAKGHGRRKSTYRRLRHGGGSGAGRRAIPPQQRHSGVTAPAAAQLPMTAEAIAAATAEGLALIPESSRGRKSTTGFYCVQHSNNHADRPFKAVPYVGGRQHYQGHFATAEEAALAVARFLGPERVAAALAAAPTSDQSRSRELPPRRELPPEWTCVQHTSVRARRRTSGTTQSLAVRPVSR